MYSDDLRLGDIIVENDHGDIVLIGFPYDEGVKRNNGRIGARNGPKSFRQLLKRTGPVVNVEFENLDLRKYLKISDGGNINENLSLEEAHVQLEKRIEYLLKNEKIPFIIGGGNDQSYPNACALLNHSKKSILIINIDAHLDVRPLIDNRLVHSGSPFRLLLEDQRFYQNPSNRFIEFACQGSQCSIEHVNYLNSKSPFTSIYWYNTIRDSPLEIFLSLIKSGEQNESDIFISFDIDSIESSSCPGVSAPACVGLKAQHALDIAFHCGQSFNVKLMDISEYNPLIEEYRTGKLVSLIFYQFLLGRAKAIRDSKE